MKKLILLLLFIIAVGISDAKGQQARIVFYNVENLFDIRDDSLTRDEEFLPEGDKKWTYERFHRKIVRIYQTLVALGEGEMPAIVGLCEIENRHVLERLIYDTPLTKTGYRIIHRESQDARGVDVALIYRPDLFCPDTSEWLTVPLSSRETTREILHVTGRLWQNDTLHIYINHWPSRYGGAGSSTVKRLAAASTLAASIKEVMAQDRDAKIIVMGDFNDEPGDESILAINKILMNQNEGEELKMINLSDRKAFTATEGTIKHQGAWCVFDQILVSDALQQGRGGLVFSSEQAEIFKPVFLLEPDLTYTGLKPFRTYIGPGYHNGFSDHLPVSVVITKE